MNTHGWLAIPRSQVSGDAEAKGWFKLHRSLLTHPIVTQCSPIVLKVWLICLGQANWQPTKSYDGHSQTLVPRGAFIFTQEKFAEFCQISRKQLRVALKHLQNLGCVAIRRANKNSLLVIENWDAYQLEGPKQGQVEGQMRAIEGPEEGHERASPYKEEELRREEHIQAIVRVSKPKVSDLNGQTSQRWEEFWGKYPRKQRKDFACSQFVGLVTIYTEAAMFACLDRYLASAEVARGVVMNPDKWLLEQHQQKWEGDWPRREKTIHEIIEEMPDDQ